MKKNQKGFALIELMVVVAIIGIIVAFAIPTYMRAANESARLKGKKLPYPVQASAQSEYERRKNVFDVVTPQDFSATCRVRGGVPVRSGDGVDECLKRLEVQ